MSNCCLVVAAATSTMYIIMAALRILMAFGLGKLQDDPQLPPMTFDGNIWLTFANIFWFWQHFLVSLVHTSCRFFVFQVHGQDIENLIVVFTLLLKQQCKYIYIGTSILKHIVKGKVDSSVASTYSYTTTAICACGVRGKVGGDLDSSLSSRFKTLTTFNLDRLYYCLNGAILGGQGILKNKITFLLSCRFQT